MERHVIGTPIGGVEILTQDGRLRQLSLTNARPTGATRDPLVRAMQSFFRGERKDLSDLPVDLSGATPFERQVYDATRRIPFGKVATYGQVAKAIGNPNAQRAVGQALGKNPIAIVIPCHRVVASNGLGGFTGGLRWKKRLLRFEGVLR